MQGQAFTRSELELKGARQNKNFPNFRHAHHTQSLPTLAAKFPNERTKRTADRNSLNKYSLFVEGRKQTLNRKHTKHASIAIRYKTTSNFCKISVENS